MGWFSKLREALSPTWKVLNTDVRDLWKGKQGRLIDDEFLDELRQLLIRTDMGTKPADRIVDRIRTDFRARVVTMNEILGGVKAELSTMLEQSEEPIKFAASGPTVIMVVGVNGSGKTTSIAKLANLFRKQGKTVVLGAGDTFRAAAVEQLGIWSQRLGCEFVRAEGTGKAGDPAAVAHRAIAKALEINADVCIVDTAGRLQTQTNLMNELEKIRRVMAKLIPDAPHESLLVLDATIGQNALSQAAKFSEVAKCTGIVLAKLDGTAKGGVAVAIRQQSNLPVKYIGVGEKADDLELFQSDRFVEGLFAESP